MQARYYDPLIGRFLSIDPVGFSPAQPFMFGRYTYVGNDPINGIDPTGEKRWGLNINGTIAFKAVGVKVSINANYDTESKELGGAVTVGYRAGAKLSAKAEAYVEPSSTKGNVATLRGEVKVEGQAGLGAGGTELGVSGEAGYGGEVSSDGNSQGGFADVDTQANLGFVSTDPETGRTSLSVGGGVGVAVGVDIKISGNRSFAEEETDANNDSSCSSDVETC